MHFVITSPYFLLIDYSQHLGDYEISQSSMRRTRSFKSFYVLCKKQSKQKRLRNKIRKSLLFKRGGAKILSMKNEPKVRKRRNNLKLRNAQTINTNITETSPSSTLGKSKQNVEIK